MRARHVTTQASARRLQRVRVQARRDQESVSALQASLQTPLAIAGLELAFCPTGEGGGQDNSCSPSSAGKGQGKRKRKGRMPRAAAQELLDRASQISFADDRDPFEKDGSLAKWALQWMEDQLDEDDEDDMISYLADQEEEGVSEDEARREYLTDLYNANKDFITFGKGGGSERQGADLGQWVKDDDEEDDYAYVFKTQSGRTFRVQVSEYSGPKDLEFWFVDDKGQTYMTGRGEAFQVFKEVTSAGIAFIDAKKPDTITFSAEGGSRVTLYERLANTIAMLRPEYSLEVDKYDVTESTADAQFTLFKKRSAE